MKTNVVMMNIAIHGGFFIMSRKSCLRSGFWPTGGFTRSLALKNVTTKNTTAITAKIPTVSDQPLASSPSPSFLTNGNVSPCTMNAATIAAKNRYCDRLVRSLPLLVITPLRAEYGALFMV